MMSHLQYMDIFSQRVDHLIRTHERMMASPGAGNFEESIFNLHVFQSMTIEQDLLTSISSIKEILSDLQNYLNDDGKAALSVDGYFCRTSGIRRVLQNTITQLEQSGGDKGRLPLPPLNENQIEILNSLYTMESERVVLRWFLNAMPRGTWEDLLHCYENMISQVANDSPELF